MPRRGCLVNRCGNLIGPACALALSSVPDSARAQSAEDALDLLVAAVDCDVELEKRFEGSKQVYFKTLKSKFIGDAKEFGVSVRTTEYIAAAKTMANNHWASTKMPYSALAAAQAHGKELLLECDQGVSCNRWETEVIYNRYFDQNEHCELSHICTEGLGSGSGHAASVTVAMCTEAAAMDAMEAVNVLIAINKGQN